MCGGGGVPGVATEGRAVAMEMGLSFSELISNDATRSKTGCDVSKSVRGCALEYVYKPKSRNAQLGD